MKKIFINILMFLLLGSLGANATSYSWVGGTSTVWNTNSNWNPNTGHPGSGDVVTINGSGAYQPVLPSNLTINGLIMSGGTLNLSGDTLTLSSNNSTFSGGTISNGGLLKMRGAQMTFSGTTISVPIDAVVATVTLNGGTFNNYCYFETTNSVPGSGSGGCTFNDSTYFFHNYSGSGIWRFNTSTGNHFNGQVRLKNISTGEMTFGGAGVNVFNGNIIMENSSDGGIYFGNDTLRSGYTISIGSGGYSDGEFRANSFYQAGSTSQSLTFTGTALPTLDEATFNGNFTITSNILLFKNCVFNNTSSFTATGSSSSSWSGGNKFYGAVTVTNNASAGTLRLDADTDNTFYGSATFAGSRELRLCYGGYGSTFHGNITGASNANFTAGTGTALLAGSNNQTIAFTNGFGKLYIKKPAGYVTLSGNHTITGLLTLNKGNLITSSSNLLTFTSTASVSSASDSSFIDGPVKKIGNSAFVFPTGNNGSYRAIEISAPSVNTEAFTAQFFNDSSTNSSGARQSSITYLMPYTHWNLTKNSGSSSIYVYLYWNKYSVLQFPAISNVARWNGSQWADLGNGAYTSGINGKVRSTSTTTSFGDFVLSYNSNVTFTSCSSPTSTNYADAWYTFDAPLPENGSDPSSGAGTASTIISLNSTSGYSNNIGVNNTGGILINSLSPQIYGYDLALGLSTNTYEYFAIETAFKLDANFSKQREANFFDISSTSLIHGAILNDRISFVTNDNTATRDPFEVLLDGTGPKSLSYYTDDNWHHIVFVFKKESASLYKKEIWIDGKLLPGFYKYVQNPIETVGDYKLYIARNSVDNFTGVLDHIGVYVFNELCNSEIVEHAKNIINNSQYSFTTPTVNFTLSKETNVGQYDENDYPLGYAPGSGEYSRVKSPYDQLRSFPIARYPNTGRLNRNFNWLGSNYLGDHIPGDALAIQEELYDNWYYLFNLCENTRAYLDGCNQEYITHSTSFTSAKELGIITNRAQLSYSMDDLDPLGNLGTFPISLIDKVPRLETNPWISDTSIENFTHFGTVSVTKEDFYLYKIITPPPVPPAPPVHWYKFDGTQDPTYTDNMGVVHNMYYWNFSPPFGTGTGNVFTSKRDMYKTDGILQREYLDKFINGTSGTIKIISENNETNHKAIYDMRNLLTGTKMATAYSGYSGAIHGSGDSPEKWEEYNAEQAMNLDNDYRDAFMSLTKLSGDGTLFLNYAVDAQDYVYANGNLLQLPRYEYPYLRLTQSPCSTSVAHNNYRFATPDFYPRDPAIWLRESLSADHGFKWLTRSKRKELAAGDYLSAPFVSPGWSKNEEDNVRPGQWLGLLKATALLGIKFFHVFANPQDVNIKGYTWQAATPAYAHAIASRVSEFMDDGVLLEGDVPQQVEASPSISMYAFNGGSPDELIVVREKSGTLSGYDKYVITGTVQPISNKKDNAPLEKNATITLNGSVQRTLSFKIRRQGSTYIYDHNNGSPIFYQLDAWHEYKHPDRWSKDFWFDAEVFDNASTAEIKTEDASSHSAITTGNYTNFTSYIQMSGADVAQYNFQPRKNETYYVWVKARMASGTGGVLSIKLYDNNSLSSTQSISCINNTSSWLWYKFKSTTLEPLSFTSLDATHAYYTELQATTGTIEIDQIVIAEDKNLALQPQPDVCGTLSSTLCVSNAPLLMSTISPLATDINSMGGITQNIIYLDVDLTVDDDLNLTDKIIICSPDVSINVQSGNRLELNNCHFFGCSDLWSGIVLEAGDAEIEMDNCIVEDAETAIKMSSDLSTITDVLLTNNIFDHNLYGIVGAGNNRSYAGMHIYGCQFRCSDRNVYGYGTKSAQHITITQGNDIEIGDNNESQNIFKEAIHSAICLPAPYSLSIENNYITDITHPIGLGLKYDGTAIIMEKQDFLPAYITSRSVNNNIIDNSGFGLVSIGVPLDVTDNTINTSYYGVSFLYCYGNNDITNHITVSSNSISNSGYNIIADVSVNNIIEINNNDLFCPPVDYTNRYKSSISVISLANSFNKLVIGSNRINNKGTYGIVVSNELDATFNPAIGNNTINMIQTDSAGQKMYGILMSNCLSPSLCSNNIQGNDDIYMAAKYGIQLQNCPQSGLNCNEVNRAERGMVFINDCSASILVGNKFGRLNLGIVAGNSVSAINVIGDQSGYGTNTPSNQYNGPFGNIGPFSNPGFKLYRFNTTSPNTVSFENDLTDNYEIIDILENGADLNSTPFTLNDVPSDLYACGSSCPGTLLTGNDHTDELVAVANDTIYDEDILKNTTVYRKLRLYNFLKENSNYLDSSVVLQDFYDSVSTENLGKLYASVYYKKIISDNSVIDDKGRVSAAIADAESANDDLTTDETYIANQKAFNTVYYRYTDNADGEIDASDSTVLADIAIQCPYSGGNAVYEARALLEILSGKVYYDDEAICQIAIEELRKSGDKNQSQLQFRNGIKVYPNPTKGLLTIIVPQLEQDGYINIMDISSRLLVNQILIKENHQTQLNIENLSSGTYFYNIKANSKFYQGKITLIK